MVACSIDDCMSTTMFGAGAFVNVRNTVGRTPLHLGADHGHEESVNVSVHAQQHL